MMGASRHSVTGRFCVPLLLYGTINSIVGQFAHDQVSGNARAVCLDNLGALVVGDLSLYERRSNMAVQHLDLETPLSVLTPEIRDEFKRRLQDAQDVDALGTAILRFGFMGTANPQGELEDFDAVVPTFDEDQELLSLLPGVARMMAKDPAFIRLSERILFTPHDRSWQIALRHLVEALEAMRRLRAWVFVDGTSEEYMDTLGIIE